MMRSVTKVSVILYELKAHSVDAVQRQPESLRHGLVTEKCRNQQLSVTKVTFS